MENIEEIFEPMTQEQIGGYKFRNPRLLRQAFVRKSYSEENGGENNEVLEFIGDKVLDIAVVRYLSEKYGNDLHGWGSSKRKPAEFKCNLSEGDLSKLKQKMVEKKALARRIDEMGLAQFLKMGKGDVKQGLINEDSVKEDLFEAILGAVALDSNWDFQVLQDTAEIMLSPEEFINNGEETDYVGLIYEWAAKKYDGIPLFKYSDHGTSPFIHFVEPNTVEAPFPLVFNSVNAIANDPFQLVRRTPVVYACRLKLMDSLPIFQAYGYSKNEARKAVCEWAYSFLENHNMLLSIKDEIKDPNLGDAINQLEILARRGYFDLPEYSFTERHDDNGNPIWFVECSINGRPDRCSAVSSSKKKAKKEAAFKMLCSVLDLGETQ